MSHESAPSSGPLIVIQQAPYRGSLARAALDLAMSYAVFAQAPDILFTGDAVHALVERDAEHSGKKSLRKVMTSLPLYDVETVFVDAYSLDRAGIAPSSLPPFAQVLNSDGLRGLRKSAAHIVSL